ncbi:hypothetical protein HYDPIDRAFT_43886 [Hydnomerulius pinastri MD-312]|uniref:Small ribosomal subunit protein uS7 domain-containing protein n=1 Tax=Hydnomerulius pinastri MD-312 TaxID=994086 RepID=A0A0C9W900_9AGAM|nr:hypothetical protein HYDPIDRAFT_43886 [Hydnomerulius pinastri MD-312]
MSSSRITASASRLARVAAQRTSKLTRSRFAPTAAAGLILARHASSSADEQTRAKSEELLDTLMGSTGGLSPMNIQPVAQTIMNPTSTNVDPKATMFIPPANDPLLEHLTSALQSHGKRSRAARLVSRMLLHIHASTRAPPVPIVREAIMAASPAIRCLSHRHVTKTVITPVPLTEKQRVHAGVKAIMSASESKPGKTVDVRLAGEMIAVVRGESRALEEKVRIHKLAMVNRGNIKRY